MAVLPDTAALTNPTQNAPDTYTATGAPHSPVAHTATDTLYPLAPKRRSRPRRLLRVTDGLTPGQYAVYSILYENGAAGEGNPDRFYRGGYADLGALTGLSKRGIQNIVGELQQKGVISLHQAPGHHRTETSVYRVPPPAAVVAGWLARGWQFALGKSKTLTAAPAPGQSPR